MMIWTRVIDVEMRSYILNKFRKEIRERGKNGKILIGSK